MLLRSLICLKGYDQGLRHLAISLAVYLLILLLWGITSSGGFAAFVALLVLPILLASAWRRVRDAGRPPLMAAVALLPWLLILSAVLTMSTGPVLYCALILALVLHLGFAFLPNVAAKGARVQRHYVQGYSGPVDLSVAKAMPRVEPTIGAASVTHDEPLNISTTGVSEPQLDAHIAVTSNDTGFAELQQNVRALLAWLAHYRQWVLVAAVLLVILIGVSSWWVARDAEPEAMPVASQPVVQDTSASREIVKMPDHFSLILEGDKLIMQWLGDTMTPGNMWDLASASGDKRCAVIAFNDGSEYRPMQVNIVANGAVEAVFSPLDTQAIVNDVAMRGSFKLCGYDFGLKGSQAALQANDSFSRLLK
ncbi:hypothetical protein [Shewanella mangrovi]|uniref:hypothetical protein n=1 Tax=Shewanella mangrovi TaxID=1515746 RepID=UPI0007B04317|nr:hypothetical protein [Shewanella mangrovi]